MKTELIRVVDFQTGDLYLHDDDEPFIVESVEYRGNSNVGSVIERQKYQIVAIDGRMSPIYAGDSKAYRLIPNSNGQKGKAQRNG